MEVKDDSRSVVSIDTENLVIDNKLRIIESEKMYGNSPTKRKGYFTRAHEFQKIVVSGDNDGIFLYIKEK